MFWFRIDNRLVHGQIIEAWLPYLDASVLVVANDALAGNQVRQEIMRLAIPGRVRAAFIPLREVKNNYDQLGALKASALFLFATCGDLALAVEQGIAVPVLNVGNMHYAPGKRQICAHVAASAEELRCLDRLRERGSRLDFRCVPTDVPSVEDW